MAAPRAVLVRFVFRNRFWTFYGTDPTEYRPRMIQSPTTFVRNAAFSDQTTSDRAQNKTTVTYRKYLPRRRTNAVSPSPDARLRNTGYEKRFDFNVVDRAISPCTYFVYISRFGKFKTITLPVKTVWFNAISGSI